MRTLITFAAAMAVVPTIAASFEIKPPMKGLPSYQQVVEIWKEYNKPPPPPSPCRQCEKDHLTIVSFHLQLHDGEIRRLTLRHTQFDDDMELLNICLKEKMCVRDKTNPRLYTDEIRPRSTGPKPADVPTKPAAVGEEKKGNPYNGALLIMKHMAQQAWKERNKPAPPPSPCWACVDEHPKIVSSSSSKDIRLKG